MAGLIQALGVIEAVGGHMAEVARQEGRGHADRWHHATPRLAADQRRRVTAESAGAA